jgi:ATP-dependent DNA helicase RecG
MSFPRLDTPVQFLQGVGPVRAEALQRLGILTVRDLLFHLPRRYDDASTVRPIGTLEIGEDATVLGRVRSLGVIPTRAGLRIFQAILQDDSGMITCAWPGQPWLERKVREGDLLLATGPVKFFHGRQMQPKEFTIFARGDDAGTGPPATGVRGAGGGGGGAPAGVIFVTYPASEELPQWTLREIFRRNLERQLPFADEEEYLEVEALEELGLPGLRQALTDLHFPPSLEAAEAGRRRLAFDEFFFLQVVQAQTRHRESVREPGIVFRRTNTLIRPLHETLPFRLTGAQTRVLREIVADMTSVRRMHRLVQGDVGSGKTVVALFAMLLAAESGFQAALMAPTELLAEQHHRTISRLLTEAGLPVQSVLLTGSLPAAERRRRLEAIARGEAALVIGTHALIQESVRFQRLGLVVVDEQHRFGVRQRMALGAQGRPDILVMSATPIPRSMALTLYGDLDLSLLDELPPGRSPVRTHLKSGGRREEVYRAVERELAAGRQGYFVYPLVDESEKVDLRSATREFERLSAEVFPERRLGLLHGQLPPDEKDRVMRAFLAGDLDLLVATSVIEVGIDVPNATVMVIEHAERFGLSQLHQLRGRVGRGGGESQCFLVAEAGSGAAERLRVFRDTTDGFVIAREDLRLRGQGDLFGSQQHGRDPILRHADLTRDEDLLLLAQRRARILVEEDPELALPRHEGVRRLLEHRWGERLRLFRVG